MFGRTDPRIGASKAKKCEEVDFEVRKPPNPPKLAKERNKWRPRPTNFVDENFFRQKLNWRGSSETRFRKVSRRSELCLRGKRPSKVSEKCQNTLIFLFLRRTPDFLFFFSQPHSKIYSLSHENWFIQSIIPMGQPSRSKKTSKSLPGIDLW